ncbi:hypothetical protein HCX48_13495 [Rhodocyclus tenuis]|uniref:Uncharacterized protein n=1 Tax=Rhodocyclus gracilis TaxID=2929842 RepID=A0ABX0WLR2_9RHOO|nr:hypothetical protein [Rhodocyclus gracilis]NJA90230.1 hypothetical protein [Rhodocyclus gracilis]
MQTRQQTDKTQKTNVRDAAAQIVAATGHNPAPWVVYRNYATDEEDFVADFATFREACQFTNQEGEIDDDGNSDLEILRRLNDGTLTTEY